MPNLWTVQLLGGLSAQRAGCDMVRFRVQKAGSLLAYLSLHLNADVSRDVLIDTLWPAADLWRGRHRLSDSLSVLRHQLEPPDVERDYVLQSDHSCVRLNSRAVTTDLNRFNVSIAKCARTPDSEEQLELLRRAVELYSGELLPGFFDDWVLSERDRVSANYLCALHRLIAMLKATGHTDEALQYALKSVSISPPSDALNEEVLKILLELGREADAVAHFEQYRKRLERTEERTPGRTLARLMDPYSEDLARVRSRTTRSSRRRMSAPVVGLSADLAAGRHRTPTIPTPLTRFFGREEELTRIADLLVPTAQEQVALLTAGPARLVTITGLGGCGKTRLATEVGWRLEAAGAFERRVAFVSLSDVIRQDDIARAILGSLQLPSTGLSPAREIREALRGDRWLLILDNCEHLIEAGRVVQGLLEDVPDLRVLATSRLPLGANGEHLFPLMPFAIPESVSSANALYEFPCVQMFVNRAQAVSQDFQVTDRNAATISAIAERLEGIPLAIELAAAHALTLTPSQILGALNDRFNLLVSRRPRDSRQRALRETIEWSFALLPDRAKAFFASLSVFHGGFTAEAVRAVCGDPDTGDLLHDITERSLIVPIASHETMRFTMLESLRDFSAKQLGAEERSELAARHAAYYLSLVQEAAPGLRTHQRQGQLEALDAENGNLLVAIDFVRGHRDEVRFAAAAWRYWELRGYLDLGIQLLERAVAVGAVDLPEHAEALHGLGVLRSLQDDLTGAEQALRKSLALTKGRVSTAYARTLNSLALLLDKRGEYHAARKACHDSLALLRGGAGDRWDIATCLNTLGRQHWLVGELREAEPCIIEAQHLYESLGDWLSAAATQHNLGCIAADLGNFGDARAAFERCLALFRDLNRPMWISYALYNLSEAIAKQGDCQAAQKLMLECLSIRSQLNDHSGMAKTVEALASIAHASGCTMRGVHLLAGATAMRSQFEIPVTPSQLAARERDIAALKDELSEHDFAAAWRFGNALTVDNLILYAKEQRLLARDQQDRETLRSWNADTERLVIGARG